MSADSTGHVQLEFDIISAEITPYCKTNNRCNDLNLSLNMNVLKIKVVLKWQESFLACFLMESLPKRFAMVQYEGQN